MQRVGLIAGNGSFPFVFAEQARRLGNQVVAIGLKEETDPSLEKFVDKLYWISLGEFGKLIKILKEENITRLVMAGQVKHVQIFKNIKLDLRAGALLFKLINKKTDTILKAVADELKKEGIELLSSVTFLPHLLAPKGLISSRQLTKEESEDIKFGQVIAKQIAGLDIGQTVVVKDKSVVAVESVEGTDQCIRRGASLAGEGVVVVKVAKPNQDFRFDLPIIGLNTITTLSESGSSVIAIDSDKTLMLDKDEIIRQANEKNITIFGME